MDCSVLTAITRDALPPAGGQHHKEGSFARCGAECNGDARRVTVVKDSEKDLETGLDGTDLDIVLVAVVHVLERQADLVRDLRQLHFKAKARAPGQVRAVAARDPVDTRRSTGFRFAADPGACDAEVTLDEHALHHRQLDQRYGKRPA